MFIQFPHPQGKRSIPIRHFVPSLITTISLCCGLASIHFTLKQDWDRAILAIILAAVFDALDGRAARLLKATSSFGAVLDSLADFLSFGVAPAILLHQWLFKHQDALGLGAVMTFVLCSALRLARFTAAVKPTRAAGSSPPPTPEELRSGVLSSKFFTGMPTPAAAAAVLIPPMLVYSKMVGPYLHKYFGLNLAPPGEAVQKLGIAADQTAQPEHAWPVILYTFLIAFLMVSRLPMFSFKKLRIHRRAVVPLLMVAGLLVVLAIKDTWLMVCTIAGTYLLLLPVSLWSHRAIMARPLSSFTATASPGTGEALKLPKGQSANH